MGGLYRERRSLSEWKGQRGDVVVKVFVERGRREEKKEKKGDGRRIEKAN